VLRCLDQLLNFRHQHLIVGMLRGGAPDETPSAGVLRLAEAL
jgi:hypothetical protein